MLTAEQILRLANIFDNAGQVALGIIVVSPLVSEIDSSAPLVISLGLIVTVVCWILSLRFTKQATI